MTASQALESLQNEGSNCISTGIKALDRLLDPTTMSSQIYGSGQREPGGVRKGQVTEIWGPPGSGRTALGYEEKAYSGILDSL